MEEDADDKNTLQALALLNGRKLRVNSTKVRPVTGEHLS